MGISSIAHKNLLSEPAIASSKNTHLSINFSTTDPHTRCHECPRLTASLVVGGESARRIDHKTVHTIGPQRCSHFATSIDCTQNCRVSPPLPAVTAKICPAIFRRRIPTHAVPSLDSNSCESANGSDHITIPTFGPHPCNHFATPVGFECLCFQNFHSPRPATPVNQRGRGGRNGRSGERPRGPNFKEKQWNDM